MALIRDFALVAFLMKPGGTLSAKIVFFAMTSDNSGIGCIRRYLKSLNFKYDDVCLIASPKIKRQLDLHWNIISRPKLFDLAMQYTTFSKILFYRNNLNLCEKTIYCRYLLWKFIWSSFLTKNPDTASIYITNDFSIYCRSLVEANNEMKKCRVVCIQHGVMTDEFFPLAANEHAVWGRNLKSILKQKFSEKNFQIFDYYPSIRKRLLDVSNIHPCIKIISQLHNSVYGEHVTQTFLKYVSELENGGHNYKILLHPQESGDFWKALNIPKTRILKNHKLLLNNNDTFVHIYFGLCSTALLDVVQAGHIAVGMTGEDVSKSLFAFEHFSPDNKVRSEDVCVFLDRIYNSQNTLQKVYEEQHSWFNNITR